MEQPFIFEKKRSVGSILEATFSFYKSQFKPFIGNMIIIMLPLILISSILTKNNFSDFPPKTFSSGIFWWDGPLLVSAAVEVATYRWGVMPPNFPEELPVVCGTCDNFLLIPVQLGCYACRFLFQSLKKKTLK